MIVEPPMPNHRQSNTRRNERQFLHHQLTDTRKAVGRPPRHDGQPIRSNQHQDERQEGHARCYLACQATLLKRFIDEAGIVATRGDDNVGNSDQLL